MADDHRRVEPRPTIGAGMAADPERIDGLRHDWERSERTWRSPPRKKFSAIMDEAPAQDPVAEDTRHAKKVASAKRGDAEDSEPKEDELAEDHDDGKLTESRTQAPLPRVQPDPRMRSLHARFEFQAAPPVSDAAIKSRDGRNAPRHQPDESAPRHENRDEAPASSTRKKAPKRIRG